MMQVVGHTTVAYVLSNQGAVPGVEPWDWFNERCTGPLLDAISYRRKTVIREHQPERIFPSAMDT